MAFTAEDLKIFESMKDTDDVVGLRITRLIAQDRLNQDELFARYLADKDNQEVQNELIRQFFAPLQYYIRYNPESLALISMNEEKQDELLMSIDFFEFGVENFPHRERILAHLDEMLSNRTEDVVEYQREVVRITTERIAQLSN